MAELRFSEVAKADELRVAEIREVFKSCPSKLGGIGKIHVLKECPAIQMSRVEVQSTCEIGVFEVRCVAKERLSETCVLGKIKVLRAKRLVKI